MLKFYENEFVKYHFTNGVLHIVYKNDVSIDLNAGMQIVEDRLKMHQDRFLPVLCDIRGIKEVNKSARDYLAFEGSVLIKAVAFIVENPVSQMLSKYYIKTCKPPVPNQSFTNIDDALNFLNNFL